MTITESSSDIKKGHFGRSAFGRFIHLPKQFKLELTYDWLQASKRKNHVFLDELFLCETKLPGTIHCDSKTLTLYLFFSHTFSVSKAEVPNLLTDEAQIKF